MQAFFPISQLIHGATVLGLDVAGDLARRRRDPPLASSLQLVSRSPAGQGRERLTLRLEQPKPCWGVMNVTGHVAAWSFTADQPSAASSQVTLHYEISTSLGMHFHSTLVVLPHLSVPRPPVPSSPSTSSVSSSPCLDAQMPESRAVRCHSSPACGSCAQSHGRMKLGTR